MKRSSIASVIYAAQIEALYQRIPMALIVNAVNSSLVAGIMATYLGQSQWLIFLALTFALTGGRAILWARYHSRPRPLQSTANWAIFAAIGSGLSGLLWGAGSALLLPDNFVEQTFVAFVIGGMCIASLVAFSNYLPAFISYAFPASLPLAGRFFLDGWTVQGDMMVVFAAALTLAAYNSTRTFINGLQSNFDLTEKTKQLTAANLRLETEIEQRRATEDQLRQAHKMEAIGQLTGGIAHDFNNLLTAVIGHLEMAEDRISDDARAVALVQAALRAAERGAALTRHLLAFGRRQHLEPKSVDIPGVVDGAAKILKQTIGPEIRLIIRPEPALRPAWADPNQLELAILNLALNARDAMPAGGTLKIEAANRRGECDVLPPDLPSNEYVVVSVSDTGTGMNQDTIERAFEPFFTTKEVGRGSGLGLSIVHGFAAQSGGSVRIASMPGNGTRVDLWLPCAQREVIECSTTEPDYCLTKPRSAHILVCDDDPDVLAFVRSVLREDGYTVVDSETPFRALEIIETGRRLDLLLIDYAMPEMNGTAVINRALGSRRGLKVLLMSGHADVVHANGVSPIPLLPKPFKVAELRRRIAEILAAPPFELELDHGSQHFAVTD